MKPAPPARPASGRNYVHTVLSGNSPGIQREAKVAGKARCSGSRGPAEVKTPRSVNAETMRRPWRARGAEQGGGVAARELAAEEDGFEDSSGLRRQIAHPGFFLGPHQDARAQAVRFDKAFHERDLVDAGFEKEAREFSERLFAQSAAAVEIVAAGQVARGQAALVCCHVAGKASCDRPDTAGVKGLDQHRVRHQPGDTAVAVKERVNPQQPVMRRGGGEDRIGPAEAAVGVFEISA